MSDEKKKIVDKRVFVRVDHNMELSLESSDMTVPVCDAELLDIGAQGMKVLLKHKLQKGLPVKIRMNLREQEKYLYGNIIWQEEEASAYRTGIMFDDAHAEHNDNVVEIIMEHIINSTVPEKDGRGESCETETPDD